MAKNLMPDIAALLGVELGEKFIIQNADRKETVVLAADGLHVIQPNNVLGPDHGKLLSKMLQGLYEVKKLPREPKRGESYYSINIADATTPYIAWHAWNGYVRDYVSLQLGIIYKTKEEAQAHMAEDYERLTGKPLDSSWVATESLDSHCVTNKSLNSLGSLSGR